MILRVAGSLILFLFATIAHPFAGEHFFAGVAQLVEQLIRNQQVSGSSPLAGFVIMRLALPHAVHPRGLPF